MCVQGWIQEFKKGGSFKRVHAERAEKFWVTTPTFAKLHPFYLKLELNQIEKLHCMHVELLHGEDYTVAKLDWHASTECRTLLGVTKNQ